MGYTQKYNSKVYSLHESMVLSNCRINLIYIETSFRTTRLHFHEKQHSKSNTADQTMAPCEKPQNTNSHKTTSSVFFVKMIATLERTLSNA